MNKDIRVDNSTGFPKLPEDHFWRVETIYGRYYVIQIRRKLRARSGRVRNKTSLVTQSAQYAILEPYTNGGFSSFNEIRKEFSNMLSKCASDLLRDWLDEQSLNSIESMMNAEFVGDYPPNDLGRMVR